MAEGSICSSGKSVCIVTTGCVECIMDANFLEYYFEAQQGLPSADNFREADFIILLGCAFNDHAERYSREVIDFLRAHKRPDAELVVMGCISMIRPELGTTSEQTSLPLEDINHALRYDTTSNSMVSLSPVRRSDERLFDLIKQTKEKVFRPQSRLANLFPAFTRACFRALASYKSLMAISAFNDHTALLRLSMGCMANCSYCAIKTARGRVISKPPATVLEEFRRLLDQGHREIALVGTNIGDYGKDRNSDLLEVLEPMVATSGDFRLRLRNLNPRWIIPNVDAFCDLVRSGKIIFVHAPMQSGNNRILELMNRGYRAEEFLESTRRIAAANPDVILKTDIMIGFPTETKPEFRDSYQLVKDRLFHYAVIMRYTDRPNTKALTLTPKVPESVIMSRYRKIMLTELFNQPIRKALALFRLNYRRTRRHSANVVGAFANPACVTGAKPPAPPQ